jgi:membrane-bound ClpP family serine protease
VVAVSLVPTADSTLAAQAYAMTLTGQTGTVQTGLRPAGRIMLDDGTFLDVVAQGEFINTGEKVVITKCTATRIVVTRVKPEEES